MLGLLAVPGVSGAPGPNLVGVSGSPMSKSPESPGSPRSPALWSVSPAPRVQVWWVPPELSSLHRPFRVLNVLGLRTVSGGPGSKSGACLAPVSVSGAPASLVGVSPPETPESPPSPGSGRCLWGVGSKSGRSVKAHQTNSK